MVGLAGCAGTPEPTVAGSLAEISEDMGIAAGTVVDTELAPVTGAVVGVGAEAKTQTDAAGHFEIVLAPGPHVLNFQALGFTAVARNVDVVAGQVTPLQITLERLPVVVPYVEVIQETGYSSCDYMLLLFTGRIPEPCNTGAAARNEFILNISASWRFLVTELTWQSGFANAETMRLFNSDDGDCTSGSACYGLVYGKQYARLEGEPGKTEIVTYYDPWGDGRGLPYPEEDFPLHINAQWIGLLVEEINSVNCGQLTSVVTGTNYKPGCPGVGVSTGIPFDVWHSTFHVDGPSDLGACCPATRYSALPDR